MAEQLVANLAEPFDPEKYTDEYRANLMKVIRAKMKGKKVVLKEEPAEPEDAKVLDLMAKLQQSLGQTAAKPKRAPKPAAKKAPRGKGKKKTA